MEDRQSPRAEELGVGARGSSRAGGGRGWGSEHGRKSEQRPPCEHFCGRVIADLSHPWPAFPRVFHHEQPSRPDPIWSRALERRGSACPPAAWFAGVFCPGPPEVARRRKPRGSSQRPSLGQQGATAGSPKLFPPAPLMPLSGLPEDPSPPFP